MRNSKVMFWGDPYLRVPRVAIISILLILGQTITLHAQMESFRFEHYSVEDGLSQRYVFEVVADCTGFLWIATEDGLNKYNGYDFKVFKHDPDNPASIGGNILRQALESHAYGEHKLWVCTVEGGLACLDLTTELFTNYRNDPNDSTSISNNSVWIVEETNIGGIPEIWVGVQGLGLDRLDIRSGKFKRYSLGKLVTDLFYDSKGVLWVGTSRGGLGRYIPESDDFAWSVHDPKEPNSLGGRGVYDMTEDHFGTLYVGTYSSVDRITSSRDDLSHITFKHYRHDPYDSNSISGSEGEYLFEDSMNNLWFSSYGKGMNIFHRETETFTRFLYDPNNPHSIGSDIIFSICEDKSGIIWFGHVNGISKWDPQKTAFSRYEHSALGPTGLQNKWVTSVLTTQAGGTEYLWVGTIGGGLCRYDRLTGQSKWYLPEQDNPHTLQSNAVMTLTLSKPGEILLGTLENVCLLDIETERFRVTDRGLGPIQSTHTGPSGYTWIASKNYVDRYDPKTGKTSAVVNIRAYAVHETQYKEQSYLWVGTFRNGLLRIDLASNEKTWYTHNASDPLTISNDMVEALYTSEFKGRQVLWVGTMAGLDIFDYESQTFQHFTKQDGLPHNHILDLVEDNQGNIWITTKIGLSRFDPQAEIFKTFWKEDGLPSDGYEFESIHQSRLGELFVGGDKGLVSFYPESLNKNVKPPNVVLTDFKLFHESVPVGLQTEQGGEFTLPKHISYLEELELTHRQNLITLEFSALDFHSPRKNKYAYKLEGFEEVWHHVNAQQREVTYTNLDPGNYVFQVKGSNNDGVWNEQGTVLRIFISPPWWETSYAYTVYIIFVLAIFTGFYRWRLYQTGLKHAIELKELEARQYREVDALKTRFFTNISHEFRTPLTLILGPLEKLLRKWDDDDSSEQLGIIKRNAVRLNRLVSQLLDLSKLEANKHQVQASRHNLIPLLRAMVLSFSSLAERKQITLQFKTDHEELFVFVERDSLNKIINNLLSNAFKFTVADDRISVEVVTKDPGENDEGWVEIIVSDTGLGIPESDVEHIFDRFYQVDGSHTRQHEGTGIGLALTKELVELHHGKISVSSGAGKGSCFTVQLRLGHKHFSKDVILDMAEPEELDNLTDQVEALLDGEAPTQDDPVLEEAAHILIVEDNSDLRAYIRSSFEEPFRFSEAADGEEGLAQAFELLPDLIISDIMMPRMDGLELCARLKQDERSSHIPIVLLTARADMQSKLEGLEVGADAYLMKPFEARELEQRILNLIALREGLRQHFRNELNPLPAKMSTSSVDQKFLQRAFDEMLAHMEDSDFGVDQLAQCMKISRQHLTRKLKALSGLTPQSFIRSVRLKRAAELLRQQPTSILEVTYLVGFSNPSYFSGCFQREFGQTPKEYMATASSK